RLAVFAVVVVAEDLVRLARAVEGVRRRKRGNRPAGEIGGNQPVAAPHRRRLAIDQSAEALILPAPGETAPGDARAGLNGQALQSGVVLVGDVVAIGLGDHYLTNQVGSLEDVELQTSGEDAERHAWEGDLEARAVGLHLARRARVGGCRARNLIGRARQSFLLEETVHRRDRRGVRRRPLAAALDVERRIPERLPLPALDVRLFDLPFLDRLVHPGRVVLLEQLPHLGARLATERLD